MANLRIVSSFRRHVETRTVLLHRFLFAWEEKSRDTRPGERGKTAPVRILTRFFGEARKEWERIISELEVQV